MVIVSLYIINTLYSHNEYYADIMLAYYMLLYHNIVAAYHRPIGKKRRQKRGIFVEEKIGGIFSHFVIK